jgi:hypothetical protein
MKFPSGGSSQVGPFEVSSGNLMDLSFRQTDGQLRLIQKFSDPIKWIYSPDGKIFVVTLKVQPNLPVTRYQNAYAFDQDGNLLWQIQEPQVKNSNDPNQPWYWVAILLGPNDELLGVQGRLNDVFAPTIEFELDRQSGKRIRCLGTTKF